MMNVAAATTMTILVVVAAAMNVAAGAVAGLTFTSHTIEETGGCVSKCWSNLHF